MVWARRCTPANRSASTRARTYSLMESAEGLKGHASVRGAPLGIVVPESVTLLHLHEVEFKVVTITPRDRHTLLDV
jgi:hypothetical protein